MQEELPPSSAWCWHTLKFITLVIYWVGERDKTLHEKNHSRVEEMSICFTKGANLKGREVFFVHLFYVVRESVVWLCLPAPATVSAAPLFRCHTRPTQARSSPRPLALAPLSLGYCTIAGKKKQTKHITHATSAVFSQQVILPFPAQSVAGV